MRVSREEKNEQLQALTFKLNVRIAYIVYNRSIPLCGAFKTDNRILGSE